MLSEAQAQGMLRNDIHAKYVALALLNLLNPSIFWYNPRSGMSPEAIADLLSSVFLHGAVRKKGRTP